MVQALPKAKVVYHSANLSALAIYNFAQAIESEIQITKAPKPNVDQPEFQHVELKFGERGIRGELSIMDYLAS